MSLNRLLRLAEFRVLSAPAPVLGPLGGGCSTCVLERPAGPLPMRCLQALSGDEVVVELNTRQT
jgi:hypothetical protein